MVTLAQHNFLKHIAALKERLAAMLWHYYNDHSPLENAFCTLVIKLMPQRKIRNLYDALPYRTVGMTIMDLLNTMANLGFAYHGFTATLAGIDERLLPCLFLDKRERQDWPDRPVVLLERDEAKKILLVYDCAKKQLIEVPLESEAADYQGRGYIFVPLTDEKRATSAFMRGQTGFTWFRALLTRFYPLFGQIVLAGLFLHLIALAMPLFIMLVYDKVISSHAPQTLYYLLPGVLLALVFEGIFRALRGGSLAWLATRLDVIVTTGVFAHFLALPTAVIGQTAISSQIARIKAFEYVRDFFSGPVFLSVLEIPFTLLAVAVIAVLAGPLVMVPLAGVLAFLGLFYVMWRPIKLNLKLAAKATSVRQQFTLEMMEKMDVLQQQGLGQLWYEKFRTLSGRESAAHFKLGQYGSMAEILAHTLTLACALAVLGLGTHAVWDGRMTVGGLLCTMILVWRVLTPFYSLCTMIPRLEQLRQSIRQVNQLMETPVEYHGNKARSRSVKGEVRAENVSFGFEGNPLRVLDKVNFSIGAGQLVVLTGRAGSGRSSLLKLLLGLYEPSYGTLRIDGADIHQLDLTDLRRQIAYVPQAPDFFEGSILENLQLAKPAARETELWQALHMADADEAVQMMPQKLESLIASPQEDRLGHALSFKLSLARAYLKNASLMLVDEQPASLLGGVAGQNLLAYLREGKGRRTVVMVCDHPDFLALADQVIEVGTKLPKQQKHNESHLYVAAAV